MNTLLHIHLSHNVFPRLLPPPSYCPASLPLSLSIPLPHIVLFPFFLHLSLSLFPSNFVPQSPSLLLTLTLHFSLIPPPLLLSLLSPFTPFLPLSFLPSPSLHGGGVGGLTLTCRATDDSPQPFPANEPQRYHLSFYLSLH